MRDLQHMAKLNHKLIVLMVAILCLVIVLSSCGTGTKVDDNLLGTWQVSGPLGFTETWTFRKDGTFDRVTSGSGLLSDGINLDNWYYRIEDGKLKISPTKDFDGAYGWASVITYEYQFGVSETETQCLILTQLRNDGGKDSPVIYEKVD